MLGRRGAARRNRQYRDRAEMIQHTSHAHHVHHQHHHHHHHPHHHLQHQHQHVKTATQPQHQHYYVNSNSHAASVAPHFHPRTVSSISSALSHISTAASPSPSPCPSPAPSPCLSPLASASAAAIAAAVDPAANGNADPSTPFTFRWPDPDNERPSVVLVASFDNFLHHAMAVRPAASDLAVTLLVPPGRHTYKFMVNGIWKTHPLLHDRHPIEQSSDGVKYHVLHIPKPASPDEQQHLHHLQSQPQPQPAPQTVFRTVSSSHVAAHPQPFATQQTLPSQPQQPSKHNFPTSTTFDDLNGFAPRGSSFSTAPLSTTSSVASPSQPLQDHAQASKDRCQPLPGQDPSPSQDQSQDHRKGQVQAKSQEQTQGQGQDVVDAVVMEQPALKSTLTQTQTHDQGQRHIQHSHSLSRSHQHMYHPHAHGLSSASVSSMADNRKSLLHRARHGWRRRFSHRVGDSAQSEAGGDSAFALSSAASYHQTGAGPGQMQLSSTHSLSRVNLHTQALDTHSLGLGDGVMVGGGGGGGGGGNGRGVGNTNINNNRSHLLDRCTGSAIFRHGLTSSSVLPSHHHLSNHNGALTNSNSSHVNVNANGLFPSSSEPAVASRASVSGVLQLDDKENQAHVANGHGMSMTPDRRKFALSRGSSRAHTAVKAAVVSAPMRVDEPRDADEVHKQCDNWRQMAKHLTDSLHDPCAARELLAKAISHREKHGLKYTTGNAQVHTDLARNLSKNDQSVEAEAHLRTALDIFTTLGTNPDQCADLKLYIGVMIDRQKKRTEAERLYRQALDMYKVNGFVNKGNNMHIAVKNLVLNLKKQNRLEDVAAVYDEYGFGHAHGQGKGIAQAQGQGQGPGQGQGHAIGRTITAAALVSAE